MNIMGIDPGKKGGIAYRKAFKILVLPMPLTEQGAINGRMLASIIKDADPEIVIIEDVHSMPGQGVVSMFTFGEGFGVIKGVIQALNLPLETVTPQRWKADVLAGTDKDKQAAINYCNRIYPDINLIPKGKRTPQDGLADALCILSYGIRKYDFASDSLLMTKSIQVNGVSIE